jgi:hypothetical protein
MAGNAVKVWDGSVWQDLAFVATGPQGVKGDTGPGVVAGGATGQVLRKKTATAYDTEWASLPADRSILSRHVLLDVQQIDGSDTAVSFKAFPANGSELGRDMAAGSDWRLAYTPPVDAWWEFTYRIPQIHKNAAGWFYFNLDVELLAGSGSIPATATTQGVAPGGPITRDIQPLYGPGGSEYCSIEATKRVPLTAGATYTLRPLIGYSGSGWGAWVGPPHVALAHAKAWAR